jgi:hypothetical protein
MARVLWKKGSVLRNVGSGVEGNALSCRALDIRKQEGLDNDSQVPKTQLVDEDWDRSVLYFSR